MCGQYQGLGEATRSCRNKAAVSKGVPWLALPFLCATLMQLLSHFPAEGEAAQQRWMQRSGLVSVTHSLLVSSDALRFRSGQGNEPMPLDICWEGRNGRQIQLNGQAEADYALREGEGLGFQGDFRHGLCEL